MRKSSFFRRLTDGKESFLPLLSYVRVEAGMDTDEKFAIPLIDQDNSFLQLFGRRINDGRISVVLFDLGNEFLLKMADDF